jgi:multiple sugar transport system permease protein
MEEAQRRKMGYALLLPAVVITLLIKYVPLLYNLCITLIQDGGFAFDTYLNQMANTDLHNAIKNTFAFALAEAMGSTILGLGVALVLNESFKGREGVRTVCFLPWIVPYVIAGIIFRWMLHPLGGIIPGFLAKIGLDPNFFMLSRFDSAMRGVLLAGIWRGFPFAAIMLLAGLQGIDDQLYEAARIDGANRLQMFGSVILPLMFPTVAMVVLLRFIWATGQFDIIHIMTGGGPLRATETVPLFIHRLAFRLFDFPGAATVSVIYFVIVFVFCLPYIILSARQLGKS